MGRSILTVHIGGCGIRIGQKMWDQLRKDHGCDEIGCFHGTSDEDINGIDTFFVETAWRYVPRCIFMDFPAAAMNHIVESPLGPFFDPEAFIVDLLPIENTFGQSYHGPAAGALCNSYMKKMRKHMEMCDSFQGFQIINGLAGGTGSGLTSLILEETKSALPNKQLFTYSVFPDKHHGDVVLQPYNSVLGIHRLIENADASIAFHNASVSNLWKQNFYKSAPTYENLNTLITNVITGMARSLRQYSSCHNMNLRTLSNNLVPYPRCHFFIASFVPIVDIYVKNWVQSGHGEFDNRHSPEHLNQYLFNTGDGSVWLTDYDTDGGKFVTMAQFYRGEVDHSTLDKLAAKMEKENKDRFVDWIPNHVFTSVVPYKILDYLTMTCLANSTVITHAFKDINAQFERMFDYGGFLHKYAQHGVTIAQFKEAQNNMIEVAEEYGMHGKH